MSNPYIRVTQLASKFSTPLSVTSLTITALYILYRIVLEKSDLDLLKEDEIFILADKIITYLFILALVGLVLGSTAYVLTKTPIIKRRKAGLWKHSSYSTDPYRYLEWEAVWDIKDPKGKRVEYTRGVTVRFLQPNVNVVTDRVWGDGDTMHGYRCSLGVPADIFNYGSSKKVVISLRENKKKGAVERFTISRTILNGFTRSEEWIEEEPIYSVKSYTLRVIFPKNRPCRRAVVTRKQPYLTQELRGKAFRMLNDGRQELRVSFRDLNRDKIMLRWWW
ncbi:hypothetical protein ACFL4G_02680 [Thermodesulfobacteriota bacterium]